MLTLAYRASSVNAGPRCTSEPPELLHTPPTIEAPMDVDPIIEWGSLLIGSNFFSIKILLMCLEITDMSR